MKGEVQQTIFITGACGFVGKFLVRELLASTGYKLVLNCRNTTDNLPDGRISYTSIDLNDNTQIHDCIITHKPSAIIHLAAMARIADGEKYPDEAWRVNYLATINLMEIAIKQKIDRFLYISSDLARNHQSVVGITKYLSEAYLNASGKSLTKTITLRLPNISWTPGSVHLIFQRLINEEKAITITHPDMSRRFIDGEEAAKFILFSLENGNDRDIFVVSKTPEKIMTLAKTMINDSGKDIDITLIGMKPGEKLEEETYSNSEIKHTAMKNLSLLLRKPFGSSEIEQAKQILRSKPGFKTEILY